MNIKILYGAVTLNYLFLFVGMFVLRDYDLCFCEVLLRKYYYLIVHVKSSRPEVK